MLSVLKYVALAIVKAFPVYTIVTTLETRMLDHRDSGGLFVCFFEINFLLKNTSTSELEVHLK